MKPALGLIELKSIARGIATMDGMIKKAPVDILMAKTVSSGKYVILVTGDVASVEEATRIGIDLAESYLIDSLFIPYIHEQIVPGIQNIFSKVVPDSIGIVETQSIASTIRSLDIALKTAQVTLIDLRLGSGIGGKGYFVLTGDLSEIQAAISSSRELLMEENKLLQTEIIPRPHNETSVTGIQIRPQL